MNTTDRILGEAMTPRQKRIYKDPRLAVFWAIKHGQRFPEAEPYILKATDPGYAYGYAKEVLKGRWPEAEEAIIKDGHVAYLYAFDVIGGRWPEAERPAAEEAIATDPGWAYRYAEYVIKGRFPEGEAAIAANPLNAYNYARWIIGGRWPEAEATIAKSQGNANRYAKEFPEAKFIFVMNGWIDWLDL